jgi:hypothetical protein
VSTYNVTIERPGSTSSFTVTSHTSPAAVDADYHHLWPVTYPDGTQGWLNIRELTRIHLVDQEDAA